MSLPTTKVEIAFDSGFSTAEDDRTWTDVSAYVEGDQAIPISYGRSDELSTPEANRLSATLDNTTGNFTPERAASIYYPNVKKGKPIRVSVRYAADGSGNFLSANQASMETSVADWTAGGSVPPTLASSTTHADDGTKSLRITWGTGGTFPQAGTTCTGLVVGRTYTAQARVWVTTGTPNVLLVIPGGVASGTATATKGAFATISVTFIATASSHAVQVWPATAPTSGQQLWVDSVMVDEGSASGTFTTSPPPNHVRYMGYIDAWPLAWPDGTDKAAIIEIPASSRRARLGLTAPLTSAIRAAYLATDPEAYWPMDEDAESATSSGQQIFRDITNSVSGTNTARGSIGSFANNAAAPVVRDGTAGPTDEESLVKVPSTTDVASLFNFYHYVGGGRAISSNTAGEFTIECVARVVPSATAVSVASIMWVGTSDLTQALRMLVNSDGDTSAFRGVGQSLEYTSSPGVFPGSSLASIEDQDAWTIATDGEIHHFAMTLTGGDTVVSYLDGTAVFTAVLDSPWLYDRRFTDVAFGTDTYNATVWVGHGATHGRALSAAEVLAHAAAATAATETPEERVVRVAGRVGVPSDEVDVESSIAAPLGPQSEMGQAASAVLDEVANSTGGVLYDTRDGHLAMQARNHRYNQTAAFTLDASLQEIQVDFAPILDDRYLWNTIDVTRTGAELPITRIDQDSIDEYGVYSTSRTMVSSSEDEATSLAMDLLLRYAEPKVRVSQVTIDVVNVSDALRISVLNADIGTKFTISNLPAQAPATSMTMFLEGYAETIASASHTVTFNTTPAGFYDNVFVLDDPVHGVLDSGATLAY